MINATAMAFLGAIALATVVMAAIQVGAIIYAVKMAKRTEALVSRLERDVSPIMERLAAMSVDASRATSLAALQVEKIDRLVTDVSTRVDRTMVAAERALVAPAREGVALVSAFKAALGTLRDLRRQQRGTRFRAEDDDALFIG